FFGWLEEHHPSVTSAADVAFADKALALPEVNTPPLTTGARRGGSSDAHRDDAPNAATLFGHCPPLVAAELTERETDDIFPGPKRDVERGADGTILSFFADGNRHVVLKAKEIAVLRPHGLILRTGARLVPDEASLTSTVWMAGVFHSMLTQGH